MASAKTIETNDNFAFLATPLSIGIYNKTTKTIYYYQANSVGKGIDESPSRVYKMADDGSSLIKH